MHDVRIRAVDGLRAVSIALVIVGHACYLPGFPALAAEAIKRISPAILGVDIFFCISGFLITRRLLDEEAAHGRIDLGRFFARRFLRLMPAYYAFLVATWFLDRRFGLGVSQAEYVAALTYTRNYVDGTWYTQHLWSLSVEEQFYLLWPLIVCLTSGRGRLMASSMLLLAGPVVRLTSYAASRQLAPAWASSLAGGFPGATDPIMAGCLLALLTHGREIPGRYFCHAGLLLWASACLLLGVSSLSAHGILAPVLVPFGLSLKALATVYIVAFCAQRRGPRQSVLEHPVAVWVGMLSYELYLWQQLVLAHEAPYIEQPELQFPLNVGILLGCALVTYYCLERPIVRLREVIGLRIGERPSAGHDMKGKAGGT
jgi:peptidoglycan/LPS O-acetylase OafA/YrhL